MNRLLLIYLLVIPFGDISAFQNHLTPENEKALPASDQAAPVLETFDFEFQTEENYAGGVQRAWVKNFASGRIASDDRARAIAVDQFGNVYVTGAIRNANGYSDYATVKYNANGVLQWTARYDGPGNGDDEAKAIAVDRAGNVLVTGTSAAGTNKYEYTTIKYNAAGKELWVAHWGDSNFSSHGYYGSAITVDISDHIIVTCPYGTIKYDRYGHEEWSNRLPGRALFVNELSHVYVLGGGVTKYDANGNRLWNTDGIGGASTAFVVDDSGRVYVTGYYYYYVPDDHEGDQYADYLTVKYDATGKKLWSARYDSSGRNIATAIGIDQAGNVYVTGNSGTIKYNAAGVQSWYMEQTASFLAVNNFGDLYLAGTYRNAYNHDYVVAKYHADTATQKWLTRFDNTSTDWARAFVIDRTGNLYITGESILVATAYDYATIKYNSRGVKQWVAYYNGSEHFSSDDGAALAADNEGNVYVTGNSTGDFLTIKYSATGVRQWMARYGTRKSDDAPIGIALDDFNNVYVVGGSYAGDGVTPNSVVTIKYNTSGVQKWVARYSTPGTKGDVPKGMMVDKSGNVYIAGTTGRSYSNADYFIIKYNSAGKQEWFAGYDERGKYDDAAAMAVDDSGNVYVTGFSQGFLSNQDIATLKYNTNGQKQWQRRYKREGSAYGYLASGIAVDHRGNVFVIGHDANDYTVIKYDHAGTFKWNAYRGETAAPYTGHWANDVAVDKIGNIYVTGYNRTNIVGDSVVYKTIKYNPAGTKQWTAQFKTGYQDWNREAKLALDQFNNVYVTGFNSCSAKGTFDYVTIKYNIRGEQEWMACYKGKAESSPYSKDGKPAYANAIALDKTGNVYVTGSYGYGYSYTNKFMTTIKYVQTTLPDKSFEAAANSTHQPVSYSLAQNYPNPFWSAATSPAFGGGNPSTTIRYAIAKPGHVTLKVYNLHGQEIAALVNENQAAGAHEIQWRPTATPSGEYLYRLQVADPARGGAGDFSATKKIILLK